MNLLDNPKYTQLFTRFQLTAEEVEMFPLNVLYLQVVDLTEQLVFPELVNTPISILMEDMQEQFWTLAKLEEIPEKDILAVFDNLEAFFCLMETQCEPKVLNRIESALKGEGNEQTQWISFDDIDAVNELLKNALKGQNNV